MVEPMQEDSDDERRPPPKLTKEEFEQWQVGQQQQQAAALEAQIAQREADLAAGHIPIDEMTGKELARYHPEVFQGY
ncbi:hypothetical protein Ndes2526B_g09002 [Nannochloris sp. 'desiccata']|nr:hypothetical protein KSW81_001443 [Chlorella desiccata (nom. nud.)]